MFVDVRLKVFHAHSNSNIQGEIFAVWQRGSSSPRLASSGSKFMLV